MSPLPFADGAQHRLGDRDTYPALPNRHGYDDKPVAKPGCIQRHGKLGALLYPHDPGQEGDKPRSDITFLTLRGDPHSAHRAYQRNTPAELVAKLTIIQNSRISRYE